MRRGYAPGARSAPSRYCFALFTIALVTVGVSAHAQTASEAEFRRWDAAVSVGLFSRDPEDVRQNLQHYDWLHRAATSVVIGRYW